MLPGIVGLHSVVAASSSAASPDPNSDPYWSNVKLLLGYTGADGSTTIIDESPSARTMTANAGAAISTGNQKFGSNFLGEFGEYITAADSNDFAFGSGDFTVETWFRQTGISTRALITKWNGAADHEWGMFVKPSLIEFYWSTDGSTDTSVSANPGYSEGVWYHIAFSRVGNTGYLCFNGTIRATVSMSGVTIANKASKLTIGANNEGASAVFDGHIDETRITKGVGRYSGGIGSSYGAPTAAFPRT